MTGKRSIVLFILQFAAILSLGLPAFGAAAISTNTCAAPASSASVADPFITSFSVTVKPGDMVLSVVDGYRAVGKTISSVVFNGSQNLTKSVGTLGNTMGAEIWSLKNPTATTANVVITYTNGGTFVFDKACARTFTGVDLPIQSSATFTTANASGGISLTGLTSTSDNAIFVDIAACNCGGLAMIAETNRTLGLNAGPNQVGSSTIITKSPAGNDTMPWTAGAVQATEAGVVYPPLLSGNTAPVVNAGPNQTIPLSAGDPKLSTNTCAAPASSASVADPFTTMFSVTVKPGDTVLSVVDGYRAVGKTISSVRFNGSENLTKSAGTLGNTMGAEVWSLKNPTATTANVVITYTNGGTFVFDRACARTFTGVDLPVQSSAIFSTSDASGGIRLTGLTSTSDKAVFVDIAACNCGGLTMTAETNRTLGLNAGPNQVGSSTIITKSPAGNDTMPWTAGAVQATEAGVVYPAMAGGLLAVLSGTATDDGLPNGVLITTWSQIGGPGPITFANASALNTTATFSTAGSYTLRLTASDGALSSTSDLTIVFDSNAAANTAPVVHAGPGQTVTLPGAANLSGTATDDGLPNGILLTAWSQIGGPAPITFSNVSALNTTATFPTAGSYTARLTASDGALLSTSDITIVVNSNPAGNTAPVVSAGGGQTVTLPGVANLSGTATDDGLPSGLLLTTWSQLGGPGTISFANASALNTTAAFSTSGFYTLRLTASDGALSSTSDIAITVNPAPVEAVDNSLAVMSTALGMQGQTNWFFYNSGDAPEGAYMGWLFQAQTLTGTVQLPRQLTPGRYYVFFYGISYDNAERAQVSIGGGTSTSIVLNDRDASRYWSDRMIVDVATASNTLQLTLTRDPLISSDQRFLFRGMYITDQAGVTMTWDGYAVNLVYPTVMDDSPPVKGNLVLNGGFEVPMDASWGFLGQGAGRTVPINTMWDSDEGFEGQGSLKLTFDSATRINPSQETEVFVSRVYHLKPNKKYTLSMWMKASPGSSTTVILSLFNTFVPPEGYPPQSTLATPAIMITDHWARLILTGYLPEYPTSDYQIRVQTPGLSGTYLLIDDVQLEEGDLGDYAPATALEAGIFIDMAVQPGNIFYSDDVLQADMVARNNAPDPLTGTLRYEIYDRLNSVVTQGSLFLSIPAMTTQRVPFSLSTGGKQGIFRLVTWIENTDRSEKEVVYSIIPRPLTTTADTSSSLGISPFYSDFQLKLVQRLGFKWSRSESPAAFCRWGTVEAIEGQFVWYDTEVQLANSYGISTMCAIGTNNDWPAWADNGGRPDLAKWRDFVSALVVHYKSEMKNWEIWNEAYAVFSADFYAQMLKVAADAIEAADPTAIIIGTGGSPADYIQSVITALQTRYPTWDWRQHIDVLSSHNYPDGIPPESLKPLLDAYGVPVWNTEAGAWDLGFYQGVNSNFVSWGKTAWPHADALRYYEGATGASDEVTENYLRTIATGQTKYFYYDSRYYASPDYFVHHPTLLEYDGTTRSKGITYAIAGSLIDHSIGLGNASTDPQSFLLVFDKAGGPVAALFTEDNNPRQITIALSSAQFQVLDTMGNPIPNGTAIRYGRIPVYVKGIGITAATLKSALQAGVITAAADTIPPNLSISDAPRGPIAEHNFRVRWIAVDDSSYPNLGEINELTNTAAPANPNAILYSYSLNGYSASWSSWSAGTYVDFKNVPSGSYTFSVVAKDTAGNQSSVVSRSIVIN